MAEARIAVDGEMLVAAPGGSLGREEAEAAVRQVLEMMSPGVRLVLLDFTAVTYMTSSALGAVIALLQRVRRSGGEMAVCAPDERVHTLMEVAGLDHLLTLRRDRAEAEAALRAGKGTD